MVAMPAPPAEAEMLISPFLHQTPERKMLIGLTAGWR